MGQYDELLTEEEPSPTPSGKYAALFDDQPTTSKYSSLLDESPTPSETPETDKAVTSLSREAQRPKVDWNHPAIQGVMDIVKGIPGVAKQVAELGYQGVKFQAGDPQQQAEIIKNVLSQGVQQGTQLSKDVQSPVGSREWTRGWLQLGLMASPGLELAKELQPVSHIRGTPLEPEMPIERPPSQRPGTTAVDVSRAMERRFTMVEPPPEPPMELAPVPPIEQTLSQMGQPLPFNPEAGPSFRPEFRMPIQTETARIGGEDASRITSTESIPEQEVRTQVGEETPFRQQGTPTGAQEQEPVSTGESVAAEVSQEPNAPQSLTAELPEVPPRTRPTEIGISQARTEAELGKGSVEPGVGAELGSGFDYGRDYINKGGDPRLPIRRALASGLVGKNEVGIVHAELDRLRSERNAAAKALEANPDDTNLQKKLDQADNAQRSWRKELQPVLTKASDALKEAYAMSIPEADPSTYEGLSNLLDEHFKGNLEVTPEMRTAMAKGAKGVKEMRDIANKEFGKVEEGLTKQLKGKKVMTPRELDADLRKELENQFKDCVVGA